MRKFCSSNSWSLVTGLVWMVVGALLAVTLASLASDIGFTMFPLRQNMDDFLAELQGGLARYPEEGVWGRGVIQGIPQGLPVVMKAVALHSALLSAEALALLVALRIRQRLLLLPFLLHSMVDIIATLAAGGALAAGLLLSGGLVAGGLAAAALLLLCGLAGLLWRAALASYRGLAPSPGRLEGGGGPGLHLPSAPTSQELLPLHREQKEHREHREQ